MPNTIANVTVPAPVIQLNNELYLTDGQYDPRTLNIPCGINAWVDDIQHWCIPIKDYGICTNVFFQPAVGDYPPSIPPTIDSILVLRVRDKYYPAFTWWVCCTKAAYYAACAACCGEAEVPIPNPTLPLIIPCQDVCLGKNSSGNYSVVFGAPALGAGQHYQTHGAYNGEELPPFESSDLNDLVSDLNTNYGSIGSPGINVVWTRADSAIIGTVQGGEGVGDIICLLISAIDASP